MQQVALELKSKVILWYLLQHSTSSFNKLVQHFDSAERAIHPSSINIWQQLKLHKNHLERFQNYHSATGQIEFETLWQALLNCTHQILDKSHTDYPPLLLNFEDSPPLLFCRGDTSLLSLAQIAMVGSRKPSPHGHKIAYDFADYFSSQNFITTSGLALGIDTAAHQGAIRTGKTIAVIGTGLDQCYPKSNLALQNAIVESGSCLVSQFLPFTPPIKINFPKRNYLISGMSLGTLVVEASLDSGSLITAKAAAEQGKQVFAIPGHIYSQQHQGCHQLIREGATLVDHPAQVLEDLTMFDTAQSITAKPVKNTTAIKELPVATNIPDHLAKIYEQLDWTGVSLDTLSQQLNLTAAELNILLMELELLGHCKQSGGRYLRC